MAWILRKDELDTLLLYIVKTTTNSSKVDKQHPSPLRLFEKHSGEIGPATMTSGLDVVLMEACRRGHPQLVLCILRCCRQILLIDRKYRYVFTKRCVTVYQTSMLVSPTTTTLTIVDILHDDDVSRISRSNTLLHLAAEGNHLSVVQILIKAGASIDPVNCCGRTPLMLGVHNFQVVKALTAAEAEVNCRDKNGSTALLIAVNGGAPPEVVSLLLDNGSDYRIRDNSGCSYLHKVYCLKNVPNVDYSKVLIRNRIQLTCSNSGLLLSSGVPLCITSIEPSLIEEHDENQYLSKDVRLSLKFLKPALCLINLACSKERQSEYRSAIHEALQFKAYHKLTLQYPPPVAAYQSLKEVTTPSRLANVSDAQLIFQNLIIVERVAGYGSFILIWLIIDTLGNVNQKCILLQHAIDMLVYRLNEHGCTDQKISIITQKLIEITNAFVVERLFKSSDILKMTAGLLSCVKRYLKMFERVHGHHAVPITSESMYRYSAYRGNTLNMVESSLKLLMMLHRYQIDISSLLTEFMQDLPLIVSPYDEIHSILSLACVHNMPIVKIILECGGDKWIHTRILKGDFLINVLLNKHKAVLGSQRVSKENISLANNLLEMGMHLDCVDSNNVPLYATLPLELCHNVPNYATSGNIVLPLTCIAANAIVASKVSYWTASLPPRVKEFIGLHDPRSFQRQLKDILDLP